ncbi:AraC family transcriptional regulator [Paenibacillus sacheonensis]|uniref:Helix-turn-helix domain-containing protein n=1 Tax=Paenibacillus sacheonensis TaxID=742054 RepID=A0A7X4YTT7_9BACL|nr:AraC family transcriptional regulator [Paenibacillus sacheonensis]MBM7568663.1 AraC-like DNA-binding protein [Paenibacillus sacheonensis]NBC72446.1 helix-turn-helix domain-containing protein [Paenibacillus sacheonensis]
MNGKLDFFLYRSHGASTYVEFHKHSCFELVYYVSGVGVMKLGGQSLHYKPGTITLTRPNYMHDERHDEATEVVFFGFLYDDFPVRLQNGLIPDTENRAILSLMMTMKEELLGQKAHYAPRVNLLLNEVILLLGRQSEAASVQDDHRPERLFYARRYMDENFTQPFQLRTLAELSGYSEDHFRQLFKEQTGLPPGQYILHKRLHAAKDLLLNSAVPISTVGVDCGFSTTSQFIELFKRAFGVTPLQYRKSR